MRLTQEQIWLVIKTVTSQKFVAKTMLNIFIRSKTGVKLKYSADNATGLSINNIQSQYRITEKLFKIKIFIAQIFIWCGSVLILHPQIYYYASSLPLPQPEGPANMTQRTADAKTTKLLIWILKRNL